MIRTVMFAMSLLLLTACGGGGGGGSGSSTLPLSGSSSGDCIESVIICDDTASYVLPPPESRTYQNTRAVDPLPSFRAVQFPALSKFDYRSTIPANGLDLEMTRYIAPNADLPDDLTPMTHRAFKLWSRRVDSLLQPGNNHQASSHLEPGRDGKVRIDFVAGYTLETGCTEACTNHYGDSNLPPEGRSDTQPVFVLAQDFFNQRVNGNKVAVSGFRVLTHEFGHIFNYEDERGYYHRDCGNTGVMCDRYEEGIGIIPTEIDFDGIRHHYSLKPDSDFEEFGIWATVRNEGSSLNEFGVKVTRTLTVDPVNRFTQEAVDNFVEDQIRIETMIKGTASNGPVMGMGTATWNGDLIAVDTNHFQPVLGEANLSMDLSYVDMLEAQFTDMERTDDAGIRHNITDFGYTLMKSESTYVDDQGIIDANFYAIGTDDIGAVAGRLDDAARSLMGVYGAVRDSIATPPPMMPGN